MNGGRIMARYLLEVPHKKEKASCAHVVESLLKFGSHFVINADWGCMDGVHKAWIIVETENKEEARHILPPPFREEASITKLNKFSLDEIEAFHECHCNDE